MHPQMTLLISGSSHASTVRRALDDVRRRGGGGVFRGVAAVGFGGAHLGSARDHHRIVSAAGQHRASVVLLLLGGNDLCGPDFDLRELARRPIELGRALRAVGVVSVYFFPILPRC